MHSVARQKASHLTTDAVAVRSIRGLVKKPYHAARLLNSVSAAQISYTIINYKTSLDGDLKVDHWM